MLVLVDEEEELGWRREALLESASQRSGWRTGGEVDVVVEWMQVGGSGNHSWLTNEYWDVWRNVHHQ